MTDHRRIQPFRVQGLERRTYQLAFVGCVVLLLVAVTASSLPLSVLRRAGTVHADGAETITLTVPLAIGLCCLAAAIWLAGHAARGSRGRVPATIILVFLGLGLAGGVARVALQNLVLHHGFTASPALLAYWGWTFSLVGLIAYVVPLVVLLTNLAPRRVVEKRRSLRLLADSPVLLCFPVVGLGLSLLLLGLLPADVLAGLGHTSPTGSGSEVVPLDRVLALDWSQLQRLSFLPLLVGMWSGMETARAGAGAVDAVLRTVPTRRVPWVAAATVALAVVMLGTVALGSPWLPVAGLVLMTTVAAATTGFDGLVSIQALARSGEWGVNREWRSAAPIGQILLVLAAPALWPLLADLARAAWSPWQLLGDWWGYIDFWRVPGITHVSTVSVHGIFDVGFRTIALGALAVLVLAIFAIVVGSADTGWIIPTAVRLGLIGGCLFLVVREADDWRSGAILVLCAMPAWLLLHAEAPDLRNEQAWTLLLYAVAVGAWAYTIFHAGWLPAFALILFAVAMRFLLAAGDLNSASSEGGGFRPAAVFGALTFLGVGMLLVGRGSDPGVLATADLGTVTDRVAVTVVAAIWIVHLAFSRQAHLIAERAPAGDADRGDGLQLVR